jgi:hypothetical protein
MKYQKIMLTILSFNQRKIYNAEIVSYHAENIK